MPEHMNRKVFFVALSLVLLVSAAGCTENLKQLEKIGSGIGSGISGPSLQDVAMAPQNYAGKEVTLTNPRTNPTPYFFQLLEILRSA